MRKKKVSEAEQIILILKDCDENRLREMKQIIIRAIIFLNKVEKVPKEKTLPVCEEYLRAMN
jgi:hypothetical protein